MHFISTKGVSEGEIEMAKKKTKVDIEKELESRSRYAKSLETDLKNCNATVQLLEREKAQRLRGWKLQIHEQTLTGEYVNLKKTALLLIENGCWFMHLYQE